MIRKEFILSELKYRFPQVIDSISHPQQAVNRPLFFENSGRKFSARIILCTPFELNDLEDLDQSAPLFLCIGEPEQHVLQYLDVCILPESVHSLTLFNFIQRLFDRLDEWAQRLKEVAETSADVSSLLDSAAGMLQNPVWLCDARCHIVASSMRYDAELNQLNLSESYKLLEKRLLSVAQPEAGVQRLAGSGAPDLAAMCFSAAGARFALVCAASERPFYGSDEVVFEHLSGFVKLMLSERKLSVRALRQRTENERIEPLLRSLLDQAELESTLLPALNEQGWDEGAWYCVAAAERQNGDMRSAQLFALCDRIESAFPASCAFFLPPVVATVIRLEHIEDESIRLAFNELGRQEGVRFGICDPVRGLSQLKVRLSLAQTILQRIETDDSFVVSFSNVAERYFCERSVSEFPAELVCLRSVLEMAAYDREHDTNYIETANRYLKNRFNAVKTANELFIHRSTFLYRLERIQAQFGLDLEAEMTAPLHLLLSLQLVQERKTDVSSHAMTKGCN